jgi:ABC-type phosphate transport system substrate-binding protein
MRSFQQVVVFLFALLVCVFAQDTEKYDATVYITSTVYRVNTITMSGSSSSVANMTSTIPASHMPTYPAVASLKPNGTSAGIPSGTGAKPTTSPFTGAASALTINAYVAALAAGVGYLVL